MSNPDHEWSLREYDRLLLVAGRLDPGQKRIGTHWRVPTQNAGPSFMPVDTATVLAEAGISVEQARRWFGNGWLSFSPDERPKLDSHEMRELSFVRSLADSPLTESQIGTFLSRLFKPYRYDCSRVAWSFLYGWVEMPIFWEQRDLNRVFEEHFDQWLRHLVATGQRERIDNLYEEIIGFMEKLDAADDEAEAEDGDKE